MELIKKFRVVLVIIILLTILIVLRLMSRNHFRYDAVFLSEPSVTESNLTTAPGLDSLNGSKLLLTLSEAKELPVFKDTKVLSLDPASLLSGPVLTDIRRHSGPILLYSDSISISARVWMILAQLGYRDIYILTEQKNPEIFIKKFRADSTSSPEF
jgi:hypothetical protein